MHQMKRTTFISLVACIAIFELFVNSLPEPRNPPLGNTGAPGETTCMPSGCHSGGSFTGTVSISGIPDTVLADQVYNLTLTNSSDALRSGFQLTSLDINNKFTGTLTGNTEVNVSKDNTTGRTYARQALAKNFNSGQVNWTFKWKAPASVTDNKLTFYFTGMLANGDGDKSKDNTVKSLKTVVFQIPTSTQDAVNPFEQFKAVQLANTLLILGLENPSNYKYELTALNGQQIQSGTLESTISLQTLVEGVYLLNVHSGTQQVTSRLYLR